MIKQEFLDYVASYEKNPGEYTEDEVYAICVKFCEDIPLGERSWDELQGLLGTIGRNGLPRKGEALRTHFKKMRYDKNEVVPNVKMLSGQTIGDITYPEFEQKTEEIKQDLYKQQTKTRDHMNAYRALLREDARVDMMKDLLKESIKPLPELKVSFVSTYEANEDVEAVLLISDLHIGACIDNFYNKYNVEIARKRMAKVVADTIASCKRLGVETLHVLNLGDLVHGQIHTSARLLQEIDVIEQVTVASEIMAQCLAELSKEVPNVVYRSCLDNHSRTMPNLKESIENENFGRLIDWYLKARLENTPIEFAEDNLDENIGLIELLNGKNLVFAHGHQDSVNTVVQAYGAATRTHIDYICLGHYHSTKMKTFLNSKVFINGSVMGTDEYAMSHRLFGIPEQTLLVFSGDNLINITIGLDSIK